MDGGSQEKVAMDAREGCFCPPPRQFKAAPAAALQWNIYIVIKESGCEDVRCESEDEECTILRSE